MSHDGSSCKSYIRHPTEKERLDNLAFTSFPEDYLPYTSAYHHRENGKTPPYLVWDEKRPRKSRKHRRKCCNTAALVSAIALIVTAILAVIAISVYLGVITNLFRSPVLSLSGKFKVSRGDLFHDELLNTTSNEFLNKAETYQTMVENAFLSSSLEPAFIAARIHSFRPGMLVFFRVYLDRRKLDQDDSSTIEIIKNIVTTDSPAFGALSIEQGSVDIDENEEWISMPSSEHRSTKITTSFTRTTSSLLPKETSSRPSSATLPHHTTSPDQKPASKSPKITHHPSPSPSTLDVRNPVPVRDTPSVVAAEVRPASPHGQGESNYKFSYGQWKPVPIEDSVSPSFGDQRTPPGRGTVRYIDDVIPPPHIAPPPPRSTSKPVPLPVGFGSVRVLEDPTSHIDPIPIRVGRPLRPTLPENRQQGAVASSIMSSVSLVLRPSVKKNATASSEGGLLDDAFPDKNLLRGQYGSSRHDQASFRNLNEGLTFNEKLRVEGDLAENGSQRDIRTENNLNASFVQYVNVSLETPSDGESINLTEEGNKTSTKSLDNLNHINSVGLNSSNLEFYASKTGFVKDSENKANLRDFSSSISSDFIGVEGNSSTTASIGLTGSSSTRNLIALGSDLKFNSENFETTAVSDTIHSSLPSTGRDILMDSNLQSTSVVPGGISTIPSNNLSLTLETNEEKTTEHKTVIDMPSKKDLEKIEGEFLQHSMLNHTQEGHGFHKPSDESKEIFDAESSTKFPKIDSVSIPTHELLNGFNESNVGSFGIKVSFDSTTLGSVLSDLSEVFLNNKSFNEDNSNSTKGIATIFNDGTTVFSPSNETTTTLVSHNFSASFDALNDSKIDAVIIAGVPKIVPQLPDFKFNPNDIESEDGNFIESNDDLFNHEISAVSTLPSKNVSFVEIIRHITTVPPTISSIAVSLGKNPVFISKACSEDELQCDSGECIEANGRCNMRRDCRDNSDEKNCSCSEFLKVMGQSQKICDGVEDCKDHSDEINCPWCASGQIICPQTKFCINQTQFCDGHDDCPSGIDEKYCVKLARSMGDAQGDHYRSNGYLMVRKQGQWGKLCLANLEDSENFRFRLDELGEAVCSALTYKNVTESKRTPDLEIGTDSYYSISNRGARQTKKTSAIFTSSNCVTKEVMHVKCGSLDCGLRPMASSNRRRIVGGQSSGSASWPWQVALYKEGDFQCGAVLVSDSWLISAGHCFYSSQSAFWIARLGLLRRGSELPSPYEQVRHIERIFLHPDYVDKGFINDIALLKLDRPVLFSDFLRPICLPMEHEDPSLWHGRQCSVVGWGKLYEIGHTFPDSLQEVRLPVISTEECMKKIVFYTMYHITENMFCAGYGNGGKDACLGDSGGPLMCQREDGRWILLGVISNGDGCGRPGRPGVYTKVIKYLSWIKQVMETKYIVGHAKPSCDGVRCNLGRCIPPHKVCDSRWDCSNGMDEENCHD